MALWKKHQQELKDTIFPAVKDRVFKKKGKMVEYIAKLKKIFSDYWFPPGPQVIMVDKTRTSKWDPLY